MNFPTFWLILIATSLLFAVGCDGLQGPPGPDAEGYDHRPPEVTLLNPSASTELIGDTLTLFAEANDSLGEVAEVEFLVNGSSRNGSNSAVVTDAPYRFVWDFSADSAPYGLVSFQAIAWDTAGNRQATPLMVLNRLEYTGLDTVEYWIPGSSESLWAIPAAHEVFDEDGFVTDTTYMDRFGSRFTARGDGDLLSAGFFFEFSSDYTTPSQLWVMVYRLDSQFQPIPLDSILVPFGTEDLNDWWNVDLSDLNGGQPYSFEAGESFLVAVRLDESDVTEESGVLLPASVLSAIPPDRQLDRGWMRTELLGWETLGKHYRAYGEFRPKMRAELDYGSGSSR